MPLIFFFIHLGHYLILIGYIAMKPQLAVNLNFNKLFFPLIGEPKIDGVRGKVENALMTGRSLKPHANIFTTTSYSHSRYEGIDGELALGNPTDSDLCRRTSSALTRITGQPNIDWYAFDYVLPSLVEKAYIERHEALREKVIQLSEPRIKLVEYVWIKNLDDLEAFDKLCLEQNYEGSIYRNPYAKHKPGRSTKVLELIRLKRFIEEEALVVGIVEGNTNNNEKQINELGNSFRSSHKENLTPNGMVGILKCQIIKDIYDPFNPEVLLFPRGLFIDVAPGEMTIPERIFYFQNQHLIIGQLIKFKLFPKGIKDKPRFPTFCGIKISSDIGV